MVKTQQQKYLKKNIVTKLVLQKICVKYFDMVPREKNILHKTKWQ